MARFLTYAAIVICRGTMAMLASSKRTINSKAIADAQQEAVGAFRTDCTSADWPPKAPSSRVPRRVAGPQIRTAPRSRSAIAADTTKLSPAKLGTSTQTITIGVNQTQEISFVFKGM
jgi:hypothetical protein